MAKYTEDEGGQGGTFIKILEGCLVYKSDNPKEGYEEYNTTNPKTDAPVKYYIQKLKGGVSGKITRLERVELEGSDIFGYNLHMEDEDGAFSIFFRDDKTPTERLLKSFENIDLDEEVRIKVFKDEKGYPAIMITQNGKNVPQKWDKDNLPQPKKVKGKWSYAEAKEFLYNNAMENIIPQFAEAQAAADAKREEKAAAATAGAEATHTGTDDSEEPIPF
jgi:hypothetical protein